MASEDKEKTEWHRLIGMILYAVFIRLRYMTEVEVDLASQRQLVDIMSADPKPGVRSLFWQAGEGFCQL